MRTLFTRGPKGHISIRIPQSCHQAQHNYNGGIPDILLCGILMCIGFPEGPRQPKAQHHLQPRRGRASKLLTPTKETQNSRSQTGVPRNSNPSEGPHTSLQGGVVQGTAPGSLQETLQVPTSRPQRTETAWRMEVRP